jgi:tetratricopeptide (TPR) repeat protein
MLCKRRYYLKLLTFFFVISIAKGFSAVNEVPIQQQLQNAIQLSAASRSNITAAYSACELWSKILLSTDLTSHESTQHNTFIVANRPVMVLCHALYASCLVKTGRDEEAISMYDTALDNLELGKRDADAQTRKNQKNIILGKAQALQRLLRYREAKHQFQLLQSMDLTNFRFTMGVVTCCLRLQEPEEAKGALSKYCKVTNVDNTWSELSSTEDVILAKTMLAIINYLLQSKEDIQFPEAIISIESTTNMSLLYQWILASLLQLSQPSPISDTLKKYTPEPENTEHIRELQFLELIKLNLSPLDDATLIKLDDKINLHTLLSKDIEVTKRFWPKGRVLPLQSKSFQELATETNGMWIAKKRAGYGSHGNQVLTYQEVLGRISCDCNDDEYLMQQVINPSLLIDGHKFSLRIYVVYFSPDEIYLSSEGLVKVASTSTIPTDDLTDIEINRIYMTNSGREETMVQKDLKYLRTTVFSSNSSTYDEFWSKTRKVIKQVFEIYKNESEANHLIRDRQRRRQDLNIPKILGLDFVVCEDINPWLIEVNRFPGLENRDESDRRVKYQVVRDAWICAWKKTSSSTRKHPFQEIFDHLQKTIGDCPYCLEKI